MMAERRLVPKFEHRHESASFLHDKVTKLNLTSMTRNVRCICFPPAGTSHLDLYARLCLLALINPTSLVFDYTGGSFCMKSKAHVLASAEFILRMDLKYGFNLFQRLFLCKIKICRTRWRKNPKKKSRTEESRK